MGFVSSLVRDLRFALRQMRQTPDRQRRGAALAGARHRRQRRDLLAGQRADPEAAAGPRAGSAGDRRSRAPDGHRYRRHQPAMGIPPRSPAGARRRRRLRQPALQPELRRRDAQRAGPVRQRPLLRHARRHAADRPTVHDRRRSARRRTRRTGGGPELRILAARIRRPRRRDRQVDHARRPSLHDHRRVAARFPRRADRPRLRRRGAARHRADRPRRGELARSPQQLVADGGRTAGAGPDERTGAGAAARRSSRSCAKRRCRRTGPPTICKEYLEEPFALLAGRHRHFEPARSLFAAALRAARHRRPGADDRVRQHGQPAARAIGGAPQGARGAAVARRGTLAPRAAAAGGKHHAVDDRRRGRAADRALGQPRDRRACCRRARRSSRSTWRWTGACSRSRPPSA